MQPSSPAREKPVTLTDATIALLLAAKIHGTNAAVQATAKRCSQRLPRSKRDLMFTVMNTRDPMKLIEHIAQHLELE
ncbi:hypothetical protein LRS11_01125 [Pseudomonas sp. J452]|nr:hypothetical protein LRS11_01125 [Pseudomonas sp. J452]